MITLTATIHPDGIDDSGYSPITVAEAGVEINSDTLPYTEDVVEFDANADAALAQMGYRRVTGWSRTDSFPTAGLERC